MLLSLHVAVAGGASQRGLAGALHVDALPVGQIHQTLANPPFYLKIKRVYKYTRELPGVARGKKLIEITGKMGNCLPTLKFQNFRLYKVKHNKQKLIEQKLKSLNLSL